MSFTKTCLMALIGFAITTAIAAPASAFDPKTATALIDEAMIKEIRGWLQVPVVQISVEAQNRRYAAVQQDKIDDLDNQWKAERKAQSQPLIAAVLSNPLSSYLTQIQAASNGLYTEIFVVDNKGLNVGQSSITSDYWQGDEAKFKKTYPVGPTAVFIDEAELEEKSKTWRTQASLTVVDSAGKAIGAVTIEVNLTELARRRNG